jgi:hypothetical protein
LPVLDPQEKVVFDGMVTRLRSEDPDFTRRVDQLIHPRGRMRLVAAILLWTLVPVCIVLGGWTGVLMAVPSAVYGTYLFRRRRRRDPEPLWWTSTRGRRPDAAI